MKHNLEEWLLFATTVAVDAVLLYCFGSDNLLVRALVLGSGVWLTFCAVSTHGARWLPVVLHASTLALESISVFSSALNKTFMHVGCDFLQCIGFTRKLRFALQNPDMMLDSPCPCGCVWADGTRRPLRGHGRPCQREIGAEEAKAERSPEYRLADRGDNQNQSPGRVPQASRCSKHGHDADGSLKI